MQLFVRKPSIDLYPGIRVNKDMVLEYKNDHGEQTLKNLLFHSVIRVTGKNYESEYNTTIHLEEGDILLLEEGGRGYFKPVEDLVTAAEAAEDFLNIKDMG